MSRDGFVTSQDEADLRQHLVGSTPAGFALQHCSTIGGLECDIRDPLVVRRALAGLTAIAQVCSTAAP